jgi:hypothetical protein
VQLTKTFFKQGINAKNTGKSLGVNAVIVSLSSVFLEEL